MSRPDQAEPRKTAGQSGTGSRHRRAFIIAVFVIAPLLGLGGLVGHAAPAPIPENERGAGPETNLPLPRYVSLKKEKANIRRGPGLTYSIEWVFLRRGMPLEITAEYGHWRKVRDVDDTGGWVHHALLRGARTAIVTAERAALRDKPGLDGAMVAVAEAGVVLNLRTCGRDWCEVDVTDEQGTHKGWADKADLWGVGRHEEFD